MHSSISTRISWRLKAVQNVSSGQTGKGQSVLRERSSQSCLSRHTSHRVLDPQDAADQVRRLAKHPDATLIPHLTLLGQQFRHKRGRRGGLHGVHMSHPSLNETEPAERARTVAPPMETNDKPAWLWSVKPKEPELENPRNHLTTASQSQTC